MNLTHECIACLKSAIVAAHRAEVCNADFFDDHRGFRIYISGAATPPEEVPAILADRIARAPESGPAWVTLLDRMEDLAEVWPWWEVAP